MRSTVDVRDKYQRRGRWAFYFSVISCCLGWVYPSESFAQSVALLYDLRHTTDPSSNPRDFPEIEFKYLKSESFGSFFMKEEIDLDGDDQNASKIYSELNQTFKLGSSSTSLHLGYSGGLGLFDHASGGYYLLNAYELGLEHPVKWGPVFGTAYCTLRYTNAKKPSYDPMAVVYIGRGFFNYKLYTGIDVEVWTTNRNLGDNWTQGLRGKQVSCLVEAEAWYKVRGQLSIGTLTRVSYAVYTDSGRWVIYPTIGCKFDF